MSLKRKYMGDVVVLVPGPWLGGGDETGELESELLRLMQRRKKIVVDLKNTWWVNSKALKMFEKVAVRFQEKGIDWCLCNVDKRIHDMLVILRLVRLVNVCATRRDSLRELHAGLPARLALPADEAAGAEAGEGERASL